MPAPDELRRLPLVVALALVCVAVALELGSAAFLHGAGDTARAVSHVESSRALQDFLATVPAAQQAAVHDQITQSVQNAAGQDKPPGLGIPYLALVDGIVAYSLGLMVFALVLNPNVQAKLQGIVTLILSFFLALGSLVLIIVAFVKLLIMVALFFAVPFGTIAYLAIWGDFPKSAAAVILSIILALKLGATICLPLAQQRFLELKSLILLVATSFLATIVVSFLQGLVPGPLVSITDALAAVIVGILALIWAVIILIGSINAVVQALATT